MCRKLAPADYKKMKVGISLYAKIAFVCFLTLLIFFGEFWTAGAWRAAHGDLRKKTAVPDNIVRNHIPE
jgi:hypothetical protein